jgi:hypothetical protein
MKIGTKSVLAGLAVSFFTRGSWPWHGGSCTDSLSRRLVISTPTNLPLGATA